MIWEVKHVTRKDTGRHRHVSEEETAEVWYFCHNKIGFGRENFWEAIEELSRVKMDALILWPLAYLGNGTGLTVFPMVWLQPRWACHISKPCCSQLLPARPTVWRKLCTAGQRIHLLVAFVSWLGLFLSLGLMHYKQESFFPHKHFHKIFLAYLLEDVTGRFYCFFRHFQVLEQLHLQD